jgi:hypothetical protein
MVVVGKGNRMMLRGAFFVGLFLKCREIVKKVKMVL